MCVLVVDVRVGVVTLSCFFQAEDGIRDLVRSRGLGDVYKRQVVAPYLEEGLRSLQHIIALHAQKAQQFRLLGGKPTLPDRCAQDLFARLEHGLSLIHI